MPFLKAENVDLYYETWGDPTKSAITLVNGFSRPLNDFRAMGRYLKDHGFFVISLDNRGAGQTKSPAFTFEESALDLRRLWDNLRVRKSGLLGISYGGALAMAAATLFPERISRLALCSTAPKWEQVNIERDFLDYFSARFVQTHEILIKALRKELDGASGDAAQNAGALAQRSAMRGFDLTLAIAEIECPTLILHGDEDRIVDLSAAKLTHSLIPGAALELFEGVGHLFLAESPKKFYERITEFFGKGD